MLCPMVRYIFKIARKLRNKKRDNRFGCLFFCRKEATRTPDPYVPNVVRYQLRYFPISAAKLAIILECRTLCRDFSAGKAEKRPIGRSYLATSRSITILGWAGSLVMSRTRRRPLNVLLMALTAMRSLALSPGLR